MNREHHNARYERQDTPKDQVPRTGYNEKCPACRVGFPHTWQRHDQAIGKHGPHAPASDPDGSIAQQHPCSGSVRYGDWGTA